MIFEYHQKKRPALRGESLSDSDKAMVFVHSISFVNNNWNRFYQKSNEVSLA